MDYYYDILLNFQEEYCMFYEWDQEDVMDVIKKIPLFHVDSKVLKDLLTKIVVVNKSFLQSIENKTKLKNNEFLQYTCVFSDAKNSLAVEFDQDGKIINRSSLILDDELNINEFMYNISLMKLEYMTIGKEKILKETRQEVKIKKLIYTEIVDVYQKKEFSKLKYIYLEWFKVLEENVELMYQKMLKKLEGNLTEVEYHIYELIKLSYNNV